MLIELPTKVGSIEIIELINVNHIVKINNNGYVTKLYMDDGDIIHCTKPYKEVKDMVNEALKS